MVKILEHRVTDEEFDETFKLTDDWISPVHYGVGTISPPSGGASCILIKRRRDDLLSAVVTPTTRTMEVYDSGLFETMKSLAMKLERTYGGEEYSLVKSPTS